MLLAGELAQVARELHPDGKVVSKEQEEAGSRCRMVEGIEAEIEAAGFTRTRPTSCSRLPSRCWQHRVTVLALKARSLDDFILFGQLLLHPLAALDETDASTRALLVIVSVSVGPWPLLKG